MMALGFAAGLPYLLIFDTLSAWLRQEGLSMGVVKFDCLTTADDAVYEKHGLPVKKGLSLTAMGILILLRTSLTRVT